MFKRIPILMYHAIEPENSVRLLEEEKFYAVTPEKFRAQMLYLKENGYKTIGLDDLKQGQNPNDLPEKPIMLTFDDGHISHYDTALPILKELGLKGVFFLVVNDMGKENRLNWDESRVLKIAGMDIGSHGMTHDIMDKIPDPSLIAELEASKSELEENLGVAIEAFSVPRGFYSHRIGDFARGMGYKMVFTSFTGNVSLSSNPYKLRRIVILRKYSMKDFVAIVRKSPIFLTKKRLLQAGKSVLQHTIGVRGYDWAKSKVVGNRG